MNETDQQALIDRMHKETLDFWEDQRKKAFPAPPQAIDDDPLLKTKPAPEKSKK